MKINLKYYLWLLSVLIMQIANAQEGFISGKVTDVKKIPIPGVNVLVKGTKISTQTDFDGKLT